jgi:hypothetical protein
MEFKLQHKIDAVKPFNFVKSHSSISVCFVSDTKHAVIQIIPQELSMIELYRCIIGICYFLSIFYQYRLKSNQ